MTLSCGPEASGRACAGPQTPVVGLITLMVAENRGSAAAVDPAESVTRPSRHGVPLRPVRLRGRTSLMVWVVSGCALRSGRSWGSSVTADRSGDQAKVKGESRRNRPDAINERFS
jgi:hypothetical protein